MIKKNERHEMTLIETVVMYPNYQEEIKSKPMKRKMIHTSTPLVLCKIDERKEILKKSVKKDRIIQNETMMKDVCESIEHVILQCFIDCFKFKNKKQKKRVITALISKSELFINNMNRIRSIVGVDEEFPLLFSTNEERLKIMDGILKKEIKENPTSDKAIWYGSIINNKKRDFSNVSNVFFLFQTQIKTMMFDKMKEYYKKHKDVMEREKLALFF